MARTRVREIILNSNIKESFPTRRLYEKMPGQGEGQATCSLINLALYLVIVFNQMQTVSWGFLIVFF